MCKIRIPVCGTALNAVYFGYLRRHTGITFTYNGLESLELRHLRFDLTNYFKVLNNLSSITPCDHFLIHQTTLISLIYASSAKTSEM
jgi:hypothetical protein